MGDPKEDSAASQPAGITSDGKTPAEQNPWYVLATIAGEQRSKGFDEDLAEKNRAYWNAWAGQHLSAEDKAEIKIPLSGPLFKDTPEWSEVEAEVTEAFTKRLPGLDLPNPAKRVGFRNVVFSAPVSFEWFYFPSLANFARATFSETADFSDAAFSETANFNRATFSERADFSDATFSENADFYNATFSENAYFGLATFSEIVDFRDATFSETAYFTYATFSENVGFTDAIFSKTAYFARATFSETALFISARFSGPVTFVSTKFSGRADFTDASFDAPCNFREAKFEVAYPDLEGTLLHAKTNITVKPKLWPPTRKQKTDPEQKHKPQTDEEAAQSCAHLRQNMAAQGLPEAAHFFFRREMTHRSRISRRWERPFYTLYRGVEYGYGVWQPVVGIIATWALGAGALWCWGCMSVWTAAGLSFSNIFRFFGFQRVHFEPGIINSLPFPLEVMTGIQTVVGFVLLFLLGLGLRNRFRLK